MRRPYHLSLKAEREAAARGHVDVKQAGQRAAQLGKGVHALLAEEHGDGDQPVDNRQVASLDAHGQRKEHELHVAVEGADGHQQAEDAAEAAVERNSVEREAERVAAVINRERGEAVPSTEAA